MEWDSLLVLIVVGGSLGYLAWKKYGGKKE